MICSIHQPNYIPYIWLFQKIYKSDIFIFYDTAQYTKWDFHNRNKIKWPNWEILLTIPVQVSFWDSINKALFNSKILSKHLKSIQQSYKKAKYYDEVNKLVSEIYSFQWDKLSDFNIYFIQKISNFLNLKTKFLTLSETDLILNTSSTGALVDICVYVWASEYLSGSWWRWYIKEEIFSNQNITLHYQDFIHPKYSQLWWDFIPYMSIIDLLFNEGKNSIELLK